VDVLHALAARYCVRQDARGFLELWGLSVGLAGGVVAIASRLRRGIPDKTRYRAGWVVLGVLACLLALTGGVAWTLLRWCYESAPAALGMASNAPPNVDFKICLAMHALETIDGWVLIVVACLATIGLLVLGIFQSKSAVRRALSFTGAAAALLFAIANGGLILFGVSWCQSQRLF
jgi:hypothetical protein